MAIIMSAFELRFSVKTLPDGLVVKSWPNERPSHDFRPGTVSPRGDEANLHYRF